MLNINWRHKAGLFLALSATGFSLFFELSAKQITGVALLGIAFAWLIGSLSTRVLGLISFGLVSIFGLYMAIAPFLEDWKSVKESAADYDSAVAELSTAVHNTPVPREQIDISAGPDIDYDALAAQHGGTAVQGLVPKVDYDALAKQAGAISSSPARHKGQGQYSIADIATPTPLLALPGYKLDKSVRAVAIPVIALKWVRLPPGATLVSGEWTQTAIDFPSKMSDSEIIQEFKTHILRPRPTFSSLIALRAHLLSCCSGLGLLFFGVLGNAWLLRRGRKSR